MVKASSGTKTGPRTDPEAIERRRMQNRLAQRKRRLKRAQLAREEKERQQRLQAAQAASQLTFINDGYHLSLNQPPVYHTQQPKVLPPVANNYFDYTPPQFEDVFSSSSYYPHTPIPPFETDPSFFVNGYPSPSLSHAPSTPPLSLYTPSLIDEELSNSISSSNANAGNIDLDPNLYLNSSAGVVSPNAKGQQHPWDAYGLMPLQPVPSPVLQADRHRSTSLPTPFTPPRSVPSLSSPPAPTVTRNRAPTIPSLMHGKSIITSPNNNMNMNMNMRINGLNLFNTSIDTSPHAPSSATTSTTISTTNKTGLHICAEQGNAHAVHLLLGYGADIDAIDEYGRTPLHYAVQNKHMDIVKLLVERGATTTIADINGVNPMQLAADSGSEEMTQMMHMMIMMTPPVMVPGAHEIGMTSGLVVSK
ncbi:ankyrin repeat domain protein [Talaromyces pinophilus]|uniref:Ankyrin repeat domain protein n=1 Tax=Talaromyces pinophilus TaxID=128442 RepID=A0A6V8H367_TALPI|nr:ankyrin repeat domain protein [Talaromyces pinophilus]